MFFSYEVITKYPPVLQCFNRYFIGDLKRALFSYREGLIYWSHWQSVHLYRDVATMLKIMFKLRHEIL